MGNIFWGSYEVLESCLEGTHHPRILFLANHAYNAFSAFPEDAPSRIARGTSMFGESAVQ